MTPIQHQNESDEALVALAKRERSDTQQAALLELLHRARRYAAQMVAARIRSRADQEELVQRAVIKIWTGLESLKSAFPGAFRAWCRRIARNAVIDFVRASQRSPEIGADLGDPPDPFTPEVAVSLSEQREALAHCMAELPDAQREVFELHAVDGLKYREIAELRDCAVGTVGPTLAAARRNLIACLRRLGAVPE